MDLFYFIFWREKKSGWDLSGRTPSPAARQMNYHLCKKWYKGQNRWPIPTIMTRGNPSEADAFSAVTDLHLAIFRCLMYHTSWSTHRTLKILARIIWTFIKSTTKQKENIERSYISVIYQVGFKRQTFWLIFIAWDTACWELWLHGHSLQTTVLQKKKKALQK